MSRIIIAFTLLTLSVSISALESISADAAAVGNITKQTNQAQVSQDTVSVVGNGVVELAPDLLDMQFTLMATKVTIAEAKKELDSQYQKVLNVLKQQNITDKDIQATQLRSNPSYEWLRDNKRVFKGFQMSRNINVTVRDFSQYPDLLQSLVDANVTMINRVSTRLSDIVGSQELALIEAIKIAKRKAELMAVRFGRNLGEVQHISEGVFQNNFPQPAFKQRSSALVAESSAASGPAEMFGVQQITARVHVVFRLQ